MSHPNANFIWFSFLNNVFKRDLLGALIYILLTGIPCKKSFFSLKVSCLIASTRLIYMSNWYLDLTILHRCLHKPSWLPNACMIYWPRNCSQGGLLVSDPRGFKLKLVALPQCLGLKLQQSSWSIGLDCLDLTDPHPAPWTAHRPEHALAPKFSSSICYYVLSAQWLTLGYL